MTERIQNQYKPDIVSAPGETLEEILESRAMSQAELADRTGRPKKTINEIVKGKAAITAETAIQLEKVLGIPASFWIAREQNYRESLARCEELSTLESQSEWLETVPYRTLAKLGWGAEHREKSLQMDEVLRYFGVASPAGWQGVWDRSALAFRQSPSFASAPGAVAAWLRKGEIEASRSEEHTSEIQSLRHLVCRL